ncbi:unnamed protein product [Chrysoparadoxa australica]
MNSASNLALASQMVNSSYIQQGEQALRTRSKLLTALLSSRALPEEGWDEAQVELVLHEVALMDSNNFAGAVGVGEREARVYSGIVARRWFRFGHGVGRSGDIAALQPKAAGSSLLARLCRFLVLDALKIAGLRGIKDCLVLPIATGMSMTLCLLALRAKHPQKTHVLWTRMDQKSCFKAILTAGLTPVVVPNKLEGDAVSTDLQALGSALEEVGRDKVLCVVTTSSCFAPRLPDAVDHISKLCKGWDVAHVINNAYGLQCASTVKLISRAIAVGRVDAVVQSTDKNFLVPVGGAIVCGPDKEFISAVGKSYPGRASAAPMLDLFVTLVSMGESKKGYSGLLKQREDLSQTLQSRLSECVVQNGGRLLQTPDNPVSYAISLDGVVPDEGEQGIGMAAVTPSPSVSFLGSMLFIRGVSGTRVVVKGAPKEISGYVFQSYGSSIDGYPHSYLTAACALGLDREGIDKFIQRLDQCIKKVKGRRPTENTKAEAEAKGIAAAGTHTKAEKDAGALRIEGAHV